LNPENDKTDDSDSSTSAESNAASNTEGTAATESSPASNTESATATSSPITETTTAVKTENTTTLIAESAASSTDTTSPNQLLVEKTKSEEAPAAGKREDRRSWVQNVNLTLDYIGSISRDKKLHFRASDHLTSRLLIGAFILAIGFATLPFFEMNAIAFFAYILADALLFCAITVFVVSRFGIIRAMEPRHALVCWHLMVGTGLLALVIGFNVVATVVLVMMRERLQLLFPGG
jgi:hypothetical protein